jgi:hypothetical protein
MFQKSVNRQRPQVLKMGATSAPLLSALAGLLVLLMPLAARAAKPRVAILPFIGPGGEDVENPIIETLPRGYVLVPLELIDKAVKPFGKKPPITPAFYVAMARKLAAVAIIDGRTSSDAGWRLRMTVRRGANGSVAGALDFRGGSRKELEANVRTQAPNWLQTLLDKAVGFPSPPPGGAPPPLVTRAPEPQRIADSPPINFTPRFKEPSPNDATDRGAGARRSDRRTDATSPERGGQEADVESASRAEDRNRDSDDEAIPPDAPLRWEISLGPRVISRAFVFTDNLAGLPGYTLPATTGVAGEATFFPAAHSRSAARHFGFSGEWATSVGAKTVGRDGARSYPTRSQSYRVGPRYQVRSSHFAFDVGADYGNHQFQLDVTDAILPPNVDYTFLRPNLSTQLDVAGGVSLRLEAAYLHILSVGGLGDENRFPRISSVGAEVGASVGYALDSDFEVRLSASLRHYAHSMHVKVGDPFIVGGAVDEHFGGSLLLTYRIR